MITTGKYPNLRLRRNRSHNWVRRLVQENTLSVDDLILPIFIVSGKKKKIPIKTMPGIFRYSIDNVGAVVKKAISLKIPMVALLPAMGWRWLIVMEYHYVIWSLFSTTRLAYLEQVFS